MVEPEHRTRWMANSNEQIKALGPYIESNSLKNEHDKAHPFSLLLNTATNLALGRKSRPKNLASKPHEKISHKMCRDEPHALRRT